MAVGIIAEFNPFHNGHKYLINTAKKMTGESVVVIMSGSFVERGGIAVTDKFTRAKAALLSGADLVIELPVTFSHNTAQKFAAGSVATLAACGIINSLAFGSESGDTAALSKAAQTIENEPTEVSEKIKELMALGISYPKARETAYENFIDTSVLKTPNDILALEYIRAIYSQNLDIKPIAIKRIGTDHDSETVTENIASASEIRRRIHTGENTNSYTPYPEFDIYNPKALDSAVISNLRLISPNLLEQINEVSEGLENRFIAAAKATSNVEEMCMAVKAKRYTLSRIRRIAYSSLIGLTKDVCSLPPSYIRILGMNDTGKTLLKQMKRTASLPIIIKPADYDGDTIFDLSSKAEDIFSLCAENENLRIGGNDLRRTPIIL